MWKDPIIEEIRAASDRKARECGYDFHAFCERLRELEKQLPPERLVDLSKSAQKKKAILS